MTKITAQIKKELYRVEISSPSGNVVIADEPEDIGGKNSGFSPTELLASSLAACTGATLRMYADRKGWELEEVNIQVELAWNAAEKKTTIQRTLALKGNLNEEQKQRLMEIAGACPVHKILTHPIIIHTKEDVL
jgi:putative redox protein